MRFYEGVPESISCPCGIGDCDSLPLTKVEKIACTEPEKQGIEKAGPQDNTREENRMKHLETFRQVVADPSAYARGLKEETGQKIVGYVCSYTPEEIILAAGGHPMRLLGTSSAIHLADSHLQTYCCALARGVLEEGLSGRASFLDGVVFPHTCDAVQRLSDIWRINIPFGFHLDTVLPVKLDTPSARAYMADILERFRIDLGQALGR